MKKNQIGGRGTRVDIPDVVVAALFPETCSYGSALLLDDGALVGNGLGRPNISDELLYCGSDWLAWDELV